MKLYQITTTDTNGMVFTYQRYLRNSDVKRYRAAGLTCKRVLTYHEKYGSVVSAT